MNFQTLESELRGHTIRPVYVIVGEDYFIASRAVDAIAAAHGPGDATSKLQLGGKEATKEVVLNTLNTVSLFGGRPLVTIRDAEGLSKSFLEDLVAYIEKPTLHATLVLVAKKMDGRSRFMVQAKKKDLIFECKPLYANQLPSWITAETRRCQKQISQEAAQYIGDLLGTDLGKIADAIERLSLYVGGRPLIDLKDVEIVVAETAKRTVFELTDAIGSRSLPKAVPLLMNILEHGEAPVMVLSMISRHMRILLKAKEMMEKKMDGAVLAKHLGVHPFFVNQYMAQSKGFSVGELKQSFSLMLSCDRALKSSRLPRERILEKLVMKICVRTTSKQQHSEKGAK